MWTTDSLFAHPVLFSNCVNAVFVETLFSPLQTRSATMTAIALPTEEASNVSSSTRLKVTQHLLFSMA